MGIRVYNAYQPLATPAQVLSWFTAPFRAIRQFFKALDEAQTIAEEFRKELRLREATGRNGFNR